MKKKPKHPCVVDWLVCSKCGQPYEIDPSKCDNPGELLVAYFAGTGVSRCCGKLPELRSEHEKRKK